MYRKILLAVCLTLALVVAWQSENYAVIITGDTPDGDAAGEKTWNNGNSDPDGFDEF